MTRANTHRTFSGMMLVAAGLVARCSGEEVTQRAAEPLTLHALGVDPPPVVLPRGRAGERFRVSQRGNDTPTHGGTATREATDWPGGGEALAPSAGTVRLHRCGADTGRGCNGGWGNLVQLDTLRGERYIFGHCASFLVADGSFVAPGAALCAIGTTGNSTAVHLHFDRVDGEIAGYRSLGADYLTSGSDGALAVLGGRDFRTCCTSGCYAVTGAMGCVSYAAFGVPLAETATTFAVEHRAAEGSVIATEGAPEAVASLSSAVWTVTRQRVRAAVADATRSLEVYAWHGSLAGNGARNPFVDTGFTLLWDAGAGRSLGGFVSHVRENAGPAAAFDLWDTLRALVPADVRREVAPPARVSAWPDWTREFELHGAEVVAGGRSWLAYVAVDRAMRGRRFGIVLLPSGWSPWVEL